MNNPWIGISQPSNDIRARRVDKNHPLNLFWAKDFRGRYLFLFEVGERPSSSNLPELAGVQIFLTGEDEKCSLVLVLSEAANWEMFFALCQDLVHVSKGSKTNSSGFNVILSRLLRWHEFLKKARSGLLTEEAIKGLIGELFFLKKHLIPRFGSPASLNYWTGPEGSPQDFSVNSAAIEIKCQSGTTAPKVRISNIDQLCPQLPEMFLWVVTLGKSHEEQEDSVNLPNLINSLRELLEADSVDLAERFDDLLYQVGYFESERYKEFSYIIVSEQCFEVKEGFPRICPGVVRDGISHVSYSIELNSCLPFEAKPSWME
ncbi:MAG: PD-(D/E)XK motif protein [Desulfovibrio sp.]